MDIFVYSDESGVFDVKNNDYYVYGGIIFLNKSDRDNANRKYIHVEREIRKKFSKYKGKELKANILTSGIKNDIFRSSNDIIKFGAVVKQKNVRKEIFSHKKSKQRFLDYVFKMSLKKCFKELIEKEEINPEEVKNIYVFVDEHTTATNGRYELREGLLQEFKYGTFNSNYMIYHPPLFPEMEGVDVKYLDSGTQPLIRLSDIIANRIYGSCSNVKYMQANIKKICIKFLP